MQLDVRKGYRQFRDLNKFPRGFGRSGDFSVQEAQLLTVYGQTLLALESGDSSPESEEERHFLSVINGRGLPESNLERVWCKYIKIARGKKVFHTLNGGSKPASSLNSDYTDSVDSYDTEVSE